MNLGKLEQKNQTQKTSIDIATEKKSSHKSALDLVGMEHVELPVIVEDEAGSLSRVPAVAKLFVSLDDPDAKGIHMSRLYLNAKKTFESKILSFASLEELAKAFVESHSGISKSAYIEVRYELMLRRRALESGQEGWRFYPVTMSVDFDTERGSSPRFYSEIAVTYSSTCPCSTALAREYNIESFSKAFPASLELEYEKVISWLKDSNQATPHAQRSLAAVKVEFAKAPHHSVIKGLINKLEEELGTPVQAAVKRADEKAFAVLNGKNQMFSEDACRKIKAALDEEAIIKDYYIKVDHIESLHPHNAVAITSKGIVGGFTV